MKLRNQALKYGESPAQPAFGKAVPEAARRGIGRTALYELIKAGLVKTFKIGAATYVEFDELDSLPKRMQDPGAQERLAAVKRGSVTALSTKPGG
jgi:hypothetical protein